MNICLQRTIDYIKSKGLDEYQIRREAGVSRPTWATWLRRDTYPGTRYVISLARAMGVTTDYLLGLSDSPHGDIPATVVEANALSPREARILRYVRALGADDQFDVLDYAADMASRRWFEKHPEEIGWDETEPDPDSDKEEF